MPDCSSLCVLDTALILCELLSSSICSLHKGRLRIRIIIATLHGFPLYFFHKSHYKQRCCRPQTGYLVMVTRPILFYIMLF